MCYVNFFPQVLCYVLLCGKSKFFVLCYVMCYVIDFFAKKGKMRFNNALRKLKGVRSKVDSLGSKWSIEVKLGGPKF